MADSVGGVIVSKKHPRRGLRRPDGTPPGGERMTVALQMCDSRRGVDATADQASL